MLDLGWLAGEVCSPPGAFPLVRSFAVFPSIRNAFLSPYLQHFTVCLTANQYCPFCNSLLCPQACDPRDADKTYALPDG